jgi:hypothetical protein
MSKCVVDLGYLSFLLFGPQIHQPLPKNICAGKFCHWREKRIVVVGDINIKQTVPKGTHISILNEAKWCHLQFTVTHNMGWIQHVSVGEH